MKTTRIFSLVIALALLSGNHEISAQELTAKAIMEKNDQQRTTEDERVDLIMKLINKKGKERLRKITRLAKTDAVGNEKSLIRFLSPADVKGTGLLTIENTGRDDDQWLYLPALRKVRRISASNRSDSFMGSDFTYEDLGPEKLEDYDYSLIKTEVVDEVECFLIAAVPNNAKEKKASGYSKRHLWIRQDNFVVIRTDFYDKKGELAKTFTASDIRLIAGTGKWRAHRMEMKNLKTGHRTVLLFENFAINQGVKDDLFTRRYLKRGS